MADVERNTTCLKKHLRGISNAEIKRFSKLAGLNVARSYPGVLTDVPTGHFFTLQPQFTGLGSAQQTASCTKTTTMQHTTIKTNLLQRNKSSVPDSCKFHLLCHISTGAYLKLTELGENNSSTFRIQNAKQITYQTLF